ncbi:MAG: hypothetical protein ACMXX9_01455 [Candidatus Woesearchaeota archaeon]
MTDIKSKLNQILDKKVNRKKFLQILGLSAAAIPLLSPSVAAKFFLRQSNGNLIDIDDLDPNASAPAGSEGEIQFKQGTTLGASNNLYWNNTQNRLGVGTNSPDETLHVVGNTEVDGDFGVTGDAGVIGFVRADDGFQVDGTTVIDSSRNIVNAGTGTFSGTVTAATPSSTNHLTTKQYVDDAIVSAGGEAVWGGITGTLSNQTDLQNALNSKLNLSGGTMTGTLITPASTTSASSIRIPHGSAPSSPVNGDLWTTTSAPLIRLNGTTRTIYHTGNLATVGQAEAEAGTATTTRAWTAQRVRQAIEAIVPDVTDGTDLSLGVSSGSEVRIDSSTGTNVTLPNASTSNAGLITTEAQTIAGVKTFSSTITGSISGNAGTATNANRLVVPDTRGANDQPQAKAGKRITADFKFNTAVGSPPVTASGTYSHIITVAGWNTNEASGGWPTQLSIGAAGIAYRQATSATAWGGWNATVNTAGNQTIGGIKTFSNDLNVNGKTTSNNGFETGDFEIVYNEDTESLDFNFIG